MDFSEEEGIIPILNQVKAFQSKWIAKNKQCETLDSFLTTVNAENKQFRAQNEELRSNLNAANRENETLRSSLNEAKAKNEKLEGESSLLYSALNSSNLALKELQLNCETSKSSLKEADTKNEELQTKYETLTSALVQSKTQNKDLEIKFNDLDEKCKKLMSSLNDFKLSSETSEIALKKSKTKNKRLKLQCKDLDAKCKALESFLNSANTKNKELEIKLEESKKEVIKVTLEKKRILLAALKKQNKLLTNPLYPTIDRLKDNIHALDEAAKNILSSAPRNDGDIEVVDIASSDDDDASTLSVVSELRSIEEDFNEYSYLDDGMSLDNNDKRSFKGFRVDENAQWAAQNSNVGENNEQNSRLVPQNCDSDIRNEFNDDICYDSDISLSVHTDDVTSTTGEEHSNSFEMSHALIETEHSYSGRVPITSENSLLESSNIECTSTIVNQTSSTNEQRIDKGLSQNNSVILQKSQDEIIIDKSDEPLGTNNDTLPKMKPVSIPKPVVSNFSDALGSENISSSINQSKNKSECDNQFQPSNSQIDSIVASLRKKYGRNLKLLNPVVVLTPVEYERPDVVEKFVQSTKGIPH